MTQRTEQLPREELDAREEKRVLHSLKRTIVGMQADAGVTYPDRDSRLPGEQHTRLDTVTARLQALQDEAGKMPAPAGRGLLRRALGKTRRVLLRPYAQRQDEVNALLTESVILLQHEIAALKEALYDD